MGDMAGQMGVRERHRFALAILLAIVVTVLIVATRWTPIAAVRSMLLIGATAAVVVRIVVESDRLSSDPIRAWLLRAVEAGIVFAVGICAGSKEGPILGTLAVAAGLVRSLAGGKWMGVRTRLGVIAGGCLIGGMLVLFGRYLHAWMQVPLGIYIAGCFVAVVVGRIRSAA